MTTNHTNHHELLKIRQIRVICGEKIKIMKNLLALSIMCLCFFTGCKAQLKVDNSVSGDLNLDKYLGDWYEIARFDHKFERGIQFCKANYSLREDGKVAVLNTGVKDGKPSEAKGKAKFTDNPRILRVSFFGPFYGDYRIMLVDEDYQWVLVGGSDESYLWILARTPKISEEVKETILAEATRRGYDIVKLIWVEQE